MIQNYTLERFRVQFKFPWKYPDVFGLAAFLLAIYLKLTMLMYNLTSVLFNLF